MSRCERVLGSVAALAAVGLGLVVVAEPAYAASLRVSQTTNLDPGGQTVTVSGSGFDPARNNGFGVYVVFGPRRGDFHRNANAYASTFWVHRNGTGGDQARMSGSGTFSVSLSVMAKYTDGDGRSVDCTTTSCYVMTFAAHGVPDRSQDVSIPVSFRGSGSGSGGGSGGTGSSGTGGSGTSGSGSGGATGPNTAGGSTGSGVTTSTASPGAGGPAQPSPAGSASPLAVQPFRQTAAGPPAQSPWSFWIAVGAVAVAAIAVRTLARRLHRQ